MNALGLANWGALAAWTIALYVASSRRTPRIAVDFLFVAINFSLAKQMLNASGILHNGLTS